MKKKYKILSGTCCFFCNSLLVAMIFGSLSSSHVGQSVEDEFKEQLSSLTTKNKMLEMALNSKEISKVSALPIKKVAISAEKSCQADFGDVTSDAGEEVKQSLRRMEIELQELKLQQSAVQTKERYQSSEKEFPLNDSIRFELMEEKKRNVSLQDQLEKLKIQMKTPLCNHVQV
jgi:hypothetical protein